MWSPTSTDRGEPALQTGNALPVEETPQTQPGESISDHAADISSVQESAPAPLDDQAQKPRLWASDVHRDFNPAPSTTISSSWSASSEKQIGTPGGMSSDRVFPIKSVVSVDHTQTPGYFPRGSHGGDQSDYFSQGTVPGSTGTESSTKTYQQRHRQSISGAHDRHTPRSQRPDDSHKHGEGSHIDRKGSTSTSRSQNGTDNHREIHQMRIFNDSESERSNGTDSVSVEGNLRTSFSRNRLFNNGEDLGGLVTARFKHIVTAEGHAVITGRDGETLQRCEDEPIHIPGAVQSFGLLIALEEQEEGDLIVRVVSENSYRLIGYTPQDLFKLPNFTDILSEEQADNLLDHVDFIRDEETDPSANGPEVFTLSIKSPEAGRKMTKMWCAMHINPSNPDLVICEFELDDDVLHPLNPVGEETPEPPEDTLQSNPTAEEFDESTTNNSKPIRVLRKARKRRGEAAAMEVFNIMSQIQEQLASAPNLPTFLKVLVGVVKELTGFHRVMVYQFDATFNGRVVTELVDPRATKDLYKGLNFPASDIPKQARELYKINKVRLLYDRDAETARLVCRSVEDIEKPLDLTFSYLRAMSPIHIKYLANMAVRSSMSISINAFGELWGLIALHSYGSKGMRVSFPIRKMCRLVGDTASRNIERLSYASRLQARKLINTVPTEANPSGYIIASSDDLLKLFDADFGMLSIKGETKILGRVDQSQEALAMLEYLRLRKITSVVTSQDITVDFRDLRYSPGFQVIAGLLLVPLSVGGSDFIVFYRRGQVKEIKWAGNPYEKFIKKGTEGYLEPRKSFKTWSETVIGKCREWTEEQVETAAVLCLVYGKFIEVWRQKEAALQSSQFTRLLLANSAHEVRTPLNAIINYLEIALEGALDQETRDNLSKSHSASKSLIYVINDLLDLTKTEEGLDLIKDEVFDFPATLREATDSFVGEAKRKGLDYQIIEHPGIPQFVHGDQRRIRQAIANITANAIQHTQSGTVCVEVWLQEILGGRATVEVIIQDSGTGMTNETLDALFRDLEQVTSENDAEVEESNGQLMIQKEKRTLGLGLATVARIVRTMDGQLRLKSEEGKGSRFIVQFPFILSTDELPDSDEKANMLSKAVSPPASTPPILGAAEGEVTLVERGSAMRAEGVSRKRSLEEVGSLHSFRSGSSNKSTGSRKSDVDRLIDAISTPLAVGEAESAEKTRQRSNSKESGRSRNSARSFGGPSGRAATNEKPGKLTRSRSYISPEHLRGPQEGPQGSEFVTDNRTLLKAVRMPDEFSGTLTESVPPHIASKVLFDVPDKKEISDAEKDPQPNAEHLQILVAEDDPVNSRIIRKRLEKSGHEVHHTVNGEDCASAYGDKTAFFDVVLMDMQMPIVDGLTSTKMIRSFEKTHAKSVLSKRAISHGRVPIFAVSASLLERELQTYINAGFDGWILKPIDFKRLNVLLLGIVEAETRKQCLYKPGEWEKGGWFQRRQISPTIPSTIPSAGSPASSVAQSDGVSSSSDSGSITPTPKSKGHRRPMIMDERISNSKVLPAVVEAPLENNHSPVENLDEAHQAVV